MKGSCNLFNLIRKNLVLFTLAFLAFLVIAGTIGLIVKATNDYNLYHIHGIHEVRVGTIINNSTYVFYETDIDVILYDRNGKEYRVRYDSVYEKDMKRLIFSKEVYDMALDKLQNKDDSYVKIDFDNLKIIEQ